LTNRLDFEGPGTPLPLTVQRSACPPVMCDTFVLTSTVASQSRAESEMLRLFFSESFEKD
jgi:hypothetical protein